MREQMGGQTAICTVKWTGWDYWDKVSVTSPTGAEVTVEMLKAPRGWSSFSEEMKVLFRKLMQGKWDEKRSVELTYAEMRLFQAAYRVTEQAADEAEWNRLTLVQNR